MQHAVVCDGVLGGVEVLECCFPDPLPGQAAVSGLVPESLPGDFRPAPVVEEFVTIHTTCETSETFTSKLADVLRGFLCSVPKKVLKNGGVNGGHYFQIGRNDGGSMPCL